MDMSPPPLTLPSNSTWSSPSISTTTTTTTATMSMMMSIFVVSTETALFTEKWKPSNTGQYAGLCIFLIVFAALFRGLISYKAILEHGSRLTESQRQQVGGTGEKQGGDGGRLRENDIGARNRKDRRNSSPLGKGSPLRNGSPLEKGSLWRNSSPLEKGSPSRKSIPWRLSTDVPRAGLDTIIATVGYFLMIAVMTMNVGYLCSVLGGTFLGSLICGRFAVNFLPEKKPTPHSSSYQLPWDHTS